MFSYALVFYFQNHWIQYIQYNVYCLRNVTLVPNIAEFRCLVSLLQAFMNEHMSSEQVQIFLQQQCGGDASITSVKCNLLPYFLSINTNAELNLFSC